MTGQLSSLAVRPVLVATVVLAGGLSDRIDGVIRLATVGSLCGTAIAAHRTERSGTNDPFVTVARWSTAGLVFGLFLELLTFMP